MVKDIIITSQFKSDIKRYKNDNKIRIIVEYVIEQLKNDEILDKKFRNHKSVNNYRDCFDCHILPDLILIYSILDNKVRLLRLCSHSELLK